MQPVAQWPIILLRFICVVSLCSTAAAQRTADGRREYPIRTVAVTEVEGEIGAEYNYFGEKITRDGSGSTRYRNNYFQEYLQTQARGYFYHPYFIDYSASLKLSLSQQYLSQRSSLDGTRRSSDYDELLGYRVRLDILKRNDVSATVTSQREERILMGLFLDRYRVLSESHSATLRYRSRDLQMDITGRHTETEDTGFRSSGESVTDTLLFNLRHDLNRRVRTDVRYRLQYFEREFRTRAGTSGFVRETETTTHDLDATNRIYFDQDRRLSLRSTFRYQDRSARRGSQDTRTYYLEEMLRYDASRVARPYLKASVRRNEYTSDDVDIYRGEAGLDGNLYDSLSYHFDFSAMRSEFSNFTEDRYGPTGRLNYRKETPLGVLSAGYARSFEQVDRDASASFVNQDVIDEPLVVSSITTAFLSRPNIVVSSIVVTDTENAIVYTEGVDYEVIEAGDRVGIRLILGGLLVDNDTVLVDYEFTIDGDESYLGDDESVYVRHDFPGVLDGLSLYARQHKFRTRNASSSNAVGSLDYTSRLAGLRQEYRAFAFTSEYETYDDGPGGYYRWLNQLEGDHDLSRRLRWGWNAGVSEGRYDDDFDNGEDDRSTQLFAGTHFNGSFARSGYWRVEARIVDEKGRTERLSQGVIGRIGYQWRRLNMEAGARFENYSVPDYEHDRVQVFCGMKLHLGRRVFGEAEG